MYDSKNIPEDWEGKEKIKKSIFKIYKLDIEEGKRQTKAHLDRLLDF